MPEQTALSGRELSRTRRAMLAQSGKNGAAQAVARPIRPAAPKPAQISAPAAGPVKNSASSAPVQKATPTSRETVQPALSGRELSRTRRAMLAQSGKNGAAQAVARPIRPAAPKPSESRAVAAPVAAPSKNVAPVAEASKVDTALDSLCEVVEQDSLALGDNSNEVRRICRDRRRALASQGKSALPAKPGMQTRPYNGRGSFSDGIDANGAGRMTAKERRAQMSRIGRGNAPPARPVRERSHSAAPVKVEVGTTLSGMAVTGTRVDRNPQVTGGESGTCRNVTGTEYVGAEQFDTFCGTRPEPVKLRSGVTSTGSGNRVTTNAPVGRSNRMTGDEAGSCRSVTGIEYLGEEHFATFCESKGLTSRPEKVVMGMTARKGLPVSGSDEARPARITGFEHGVTQNVTGSQYADTGVSRMTINGPTKVALTHTLAGRPVSGTVVGASVKVTGEEAGVCRNVSGTEYLSTEQFQSVCSTRPEPAPAKVGVDKSLGGQRITGNLVDASEKVTGNEPGSNERVTGAQYGSPAMRRNGVEKVTEMRTLAGRAMTGTMVGRGPKLTGDEHGGCQPVTGTEYYGRESFDAYCSGTPAPAAAKVGISQTGRGLAMSGTMLERTEHVTGNEPGSSLPISGTPYAGQTMAAGIDRSFNAKPMTGSRMPPRQSRYVAPADMPMPQVVVESVVVEERSRPAGFSISSPARFAQETRQRVTGSSYRGSSTITGPAAMADGLVSGTPEFRYRDDMGGQRVVQATPVAVQPVTPPAQLATVVEEISQASRITGNGRETGTRITGDDWARSGRVTGTEGRWAQSRNPTLRGGEVRNMTPFARANKEVERVEVPPAKVTGASGNSAKGAMITVSGGARG